MLNKQYDKYDKIKFRGEIMRKNKFRIIAIALLIFMLPATSFGLEQLSIERATALAKEENADEKEDIDEQISDLWESYGDAQDLKDQMEDTMDALEDFEELYDEKYEDGEQLTEAENKILAGYQAMFGKEPPNYSQQDLYEKFVKPQFAYYQIRMTIEKVKNQKDLFDQRIETQIQNSYVQIVNLEDTLHLQKTYEENLKNKYENDQLKYELGQISAVQLMESRLDYQKKVLNNEQLKRNLTTAKLNFKQALGIDLYEDIELTSNVLYFKNVELKDYSYYEEQALNNRIEILNAEFDYKQAQSEAEITRDYLDQELLTDRINYDSNEIDALNALNQAKENVSQDIYIAYFDTLEKQETYEVKVKEYKRAQQDFREKTEMYNLGYLDKNTLDMVEFALDASKTELFVAVRELDTSYSNLMNAINLGPGYQDSNMGGRF